MPAEPCKTCGQPHVSTAPSGRYRTERTYATCGGHVTRDRDRYVPGKERPLLDNPRPCHVRRPADAEAGWTCKNHGGTAPQVQAARQRRGIERKATEVMRRFGEPVDTTPSEALLDTVKWTAGYVGWLRNKVATAADDAELTQHSALSGKAEGSVWVDLLGTWHDRLVRICAEAIRAGIEERRVRLAESQGKLLADVIRGILADLNLTDEQEALVSAVVPRHLRAVAS